MELEEAIKKLKKPKKIALITLIRQFKREGIENFVVTRPEIIETILNHLTKQEKMIELMAEELAFGVFDFKSKKQAKQYFEKKAEESE